MREDNAQQPPNSNTFFYKPPDGQKELLALRSSDGRVIVAPPDLTEMTKRDGEQESTCYHS